MGAISDIRNDRQAKTRKQSRLSNLQKPVNHLERASDIIVDSNTFMDALLATVDGGAIFQIGFTKDRSALRLHIYEDGVPLDIYVGTETALNEACAALIDSFK